MELNEWLVLVLLTLVGIFALVFASNGEGGMQSTIGLLMPRPRSLASSIA